jgi:hypothetical protein
MPGDGIAGFEFARDQKSNPIRRHTGGYRFFLGCACSQVIETDHRQDSKDGRYYD